MGVAIQAFLEFARQSGIDSQHWQLLLDADQSPHDPDRLLHERSIVRQRKLDGLNRVQGLAEDAAAEYPPAAEVMFTLQSQVFDALQLKPISDPDEFNSAFRRRRTELLSA